MDGKRHREQDDVEKKERKRKKKKDLYHWYNFQMNGSEIKRDSINTARGVFQLYCYHSANLCFQLILLVAGGSLCLV